jgi:hypothetical protein
MRNNFHGVGGVGGVGEHVNFRTYYPHQKGWLWGVGVGAWVAKRRRPP